MATSTFNPYESLATDIVSGMNTIVTNLTGASTVDDLVSEITNIVTSTFYPVVPVPRQLELEISSVAYNIINAYNNGALATGTIPYNEQQYNFCDLMLGSTTTSLTPVETLNQWLLDIEDNITKGDMSIDQQTPLLLGILTGKTIYTYWVDEVRTPIKWSAYFLTQESENFASIPLWIGAAMDGALIGANASQKGLIAPTTEITSVDIISSFIGALAIGAGKVIFKWVPRIQPIDVTPGLTIGESSRFNSGGFGGGTKKRTTNRKNEQNPGSKDIKYKRDELNMTQAEHNDLNPGLGGMDWWPD